MIGRNPRATVFQQRCVICPGVWSAKRTTAYALLCFEHTNCDTGLAELQGGGSTCYAGSDCDNRFHIFSYI